MDKPTFTQWVIYDFITPWISKTCAYFSKTILLDSEATEGLMPEELQERSNPAMGGSHQLARIQEPVTERFTVPMLPSNEHVSVSNCLEETEKTERPRRTESVKTHLHHAVSQFSRSLHWEAKTQGLGALGSRPAEGRHCSPAPRRASSAEPSSRSMGMNQYCPTAQMRLGMELTCIG